MSIRISSLSLIFQTLSNFSKSTAQDYDKRIDEKLPRKEILKNCGILNLDKRYMNSKEAERILNKMKTKLYPHILQKYVGCQRLKNINKEMRDYIGIKNRRKSPKNY